MDTNGYIYKVFRVYFSWRRNMNQQTHYQPKRRRRRPIYYLVETEDAMEFVLGRKNLGECVATMIGDTTEIMTVTEYYTIEDIRQDFPSFTKDMIGEYIEK